MTPEQLAALMEWIERRLTDIHCNELTGGYASEQARLAMYGAFGFEEGPCNEPVAPGTYPPTSGDRTALTP